MIVLYAYLLCIFFIQGIWLLTYLFDKEMIMIATPGELHDVGISWFSSIVIWLMEFMCIPMIWIPYGIFRIFYYITHRRAK